MKTTAARLAFVVCLLLTSAFALAQMTETKCRINVPFDFIVADTAFSAGEYMIYSDALSGRMRIVNLVTNQATTILTRDVIRTSDNSTSRLVFRRDHTGQHILHQFWSVGDDHGHDAIHVAQIEDVK